LGHAAFHHLLFSFFNWSKSSGVRNSVKICRFAKKRPCIFVWAVTQSGTVKKRTWTTRQKKPTDSKKWPKTPEDNRDKNKSLTENKRRTHQDPAAAVAPVGYAILDSPELAALSRDILLKIQ
jgi:Na+(H+)/acetate symporter ActP